MRVALTNKRMALRIVSDDGDKVFRNVIEYVCAKDHFFIYLQKPNNETECEVIERWRINAVRRIGNDGQEWTLKLPQFKKVR